MPDFKTFRYPNVYVFTMNFHIFFQLKVTSSILLVILPNLLHPANSEFGNSTNLWHQNCKLRGIICLFAIWSYQVWHFVRRLACHLTLSCRSYSSGPWPHWRQQSERSEATEAGRQSPLSLLSLRTLADLLLFSLFDSCKHKTDTHIRFNVTTHFFLIQANLNFSLNITTLRWKII